MKALKQAILNAASATGIPSGESGLWTINKFDVAKRALMKRGEQFVVVVPGTYTQLLVATAKSLMHGGELVMTDCLPELNKHMIFMLRATGTVLIGGLGLGCVTRGCLANPRVTSVTVLERDKDVLRLVAPHMPADPRLKIIHAEAEQWVNESDAKFDCAWTDLWTDEERGEEHLQVKHSKVMASLHGRVKFQGAWEFPRAQRRRWKSLDIL